MEGSKIKGLSFVVAMMHEMKEHMKKSLDWIERGVY